MSLAKEAEKGIKVIFLNQINHELMKRLDWITGIKNGDPQCRHHFSNARGLEECGSE